MPHLNTENEIVRKLVTAVAAVAAFAALAGFVAFRAQARTADDGLTAIYVEPGSTEIARLEANAHAELSTAVAAGDRILLAAALDGTDATTHTGDLGCGAGANALQCQRDVEEAHLDALEAVNGLLTAPAPATVDAFASVRGITEFLAQHPGPKSVSLFMNISGRHDIAPVDISAPDLAARIAQVVDQALTSGLFPEDTTGVSAYVLMPYSGDAGHDAAVEAVFERLFEETGGELAYFGQTWMTGVYSAALPDFAAEGVTGTRTGAQTTISLNSALFDTDSAAIRPDVLPALDEIAARIASLTDVRSIEIVGLADASGDPLYNQELTTRRADSVRDELLARLDLAALGITDQQVTSVGAGSAPEAGPDDQRYRRVDIIVTAREME